VSVSAASRNASAVVTAVYDRRNAFSDLFSSPALAAAATLPRLIRFDDSMLQRSPMIFFDSTIHAAKTIR
jgi:hypothetical protein